MKYLKLFNKKSEYYNLNNNDNITPNVNAFMSTDKIIYNNTTKKHKLYNIAYWDGDKIDSLPLNEWSGDLGTPIGIVVIESGFLPDGRARVICLHHISENGVCSPNTISQSVWSNEEKETGLQNYSKIPLNNNGSTKYTYVSGTHGGMIPSEIFNYHKSITDYKTFYSDYNTYIDYDLYIPSPYLNNKLHPIYLEETDGGNCLNDFNGYENTKYLSESETGNTLASLCWNYNDGVSNTKWYLPSIGELSVMFARIKKIDEIICLMGGTPFLIINSPYNSLYASSTEYDNSSVYAMISTHGVIGAISKINHYLVKPFALI